MPLGLFPRETADILAGGVDTGTTPPIKPDFWTGTFNGIVPAIGQGLESMAFALESPSKYANVGPPRMFPSSVEPNQYTEAIKAAGKISDEDYATQLANETTAALKSFTPDPHVVGTAGQTLFGLASGLTRIAAGAAVAGPIGGAVAVGGSEGVATSRELASHGVDADTANALGAGAALFSGAGALLPGGVGKTLLERVTSGAYGQFGLGMLNRGLMHNVLDEAGYPDMAKAYQTLDGAGVLSDIVLGMGFGAVHHVMAPKPSDLDAAHAVKDAEQTEHAAGGPATEPQSRTNIIDNQTAAAEKLMQGDDVPGNSKDVAYVPDPAQEAAREATARGVDEAAAEVGATRVEAPVEPREPSEIVSEVQARTQPEPPKSEGAEPAAELDPVTAETVGQAQGILDRLGDLKIENEDGESVSAADALRRSVDDIKAAQGEGELHRVAAACFGRG